MSEAGITASEVTRAFGSTQVLRCASLSVAPGEITALVGPNGSGKTTLMLTLATLLRPDSGSVRIAGHDIVTATRSARSALGWMPDTLGVWSGLSVRETLGATCALYGITGSAVPTRVAELLAEVGLETLADQRSHTLSRGQKQRLSLARSIAHRPSVLLLDEPASGLDPEARLAQRASLARLAGEGTAILITSHVLDELEHLASSVVFLRDGTTVTDGIKPVWSEQAVWRIRSVDPALLTKSLGDLGIASTLHTGLTGDAQLVELPHEMAAQALLSDLVSRGVPVVEYGPATGSLERAFTRVTGGQA